MYKHRRPLATRGGAGASPPLPPIAGPAAALQTTPMGRFLLAFGGIAATLGGCAPPGGAQPSLCEIAATPQAFRGRSLTAEGVLLVSRHGSMITDAACEAGVAIQWRGGQGGLATLNDVVERELALPAVSRTVRLRVTGEMKQAATPDRTGAPGWFLDLRSADILSDRAAAP